MDIEKEIKEIISKSDSLDRAVFTITIMVLKRIVGKAWSDDTEAEKFHRYLENGQTEEAVQMIRDNENEKDISRNIRKLHNKMDEEYEDEEEAESSFLEIFE